MYSFNGALQSACTIGNKLFLAGDGGRIVKATITPAAGLAQSNEEVVTGLLLYVCNKWPKSARTPAFCSVLSAAGKKRFGDFPPCTEPSCSA